MIGLSLAVCPIRQSLVPLLVASVPFTSDKIPTSLSFFGPFFLCFSWVLQMVGHRYIFASKFVSHTPLRRSPVLFLLVPLLYMLISSPFFRLLSAASTLSLTSTFDSAPSFSCCVSPNIFRRSFILACLSHPSFSRCERSYLCCVTHW